MIYTYSRAAGQGQETTYYAPWLLQSFHPVRGFSRSVESDVAVA
jgi:hypothetical protein